MQRAFDAMLAGRVGPAAPETPMTAVDRAVNRAVKEHNTSRTDLDELRHCCHKAWTRAAVKREGRRALRRIGRALVRAESAP